MLARRPIGRVQVVNLSDQKISFHGPEVTDPVAQSALVEHVGSKSSLGTDALAGPYKWYRGGDFTKVAGEFFLNPGETFLLRVPEENPQVKPGLVQLFNGKDLTGWTNPKKEFASWRVEKGVLIGKGDQAFLRTERGPYGDFHLRMEARYIGGSAGLILREQSPEVAGAGYECLLETNKAVNFNTGTIVIMATKTLMGKFAIPEQPLTKPGQWFTLEVIARGNKIDTLVNGQKAVNFVDPHGDFKAGNLALNVRGQGGELHVRRIEVRREGGDRGIIRKVVDSSCHS